MIGFVALSILYIAAQQMMLAYVSYEVKNKLALL